MAEVRTIETAEASGRALAAIRRLLEAAFDGGFSAEDWDHTLGGHHVTVTEGNLLVAHAAVVPRTLEIGARPVFAGYVEGVATRPDARRRGFGSLAMNEATRIVRARFEMGALSTDRHAFYERLGWERWRGPSFVRRGTDLIRTEDEDEGLMVLRFGPSAEISLADSIACQARAGDDW